MKINRPEIVFKGCGGLHDIFDDVIKSAYNITDDEYDFICINASDEDLDTWTLGQNPTFTERRKSLEIRNKYLKLYNEQLNK